MTESATTPTVPALSEGKDLLRLAWLNFEAGGRLPAGDYDFSQLQRLTAPLHHPLPRPGAEQPVAVLALCEAKQWGANANAALYAAASAVREQLDRPYTAKLCTPSRGPISPAVLWDPTQVEPVQWHDDNGYPDYADKTDVVRFRAIATGHEFLIIVRHWPPLSPQQRKEEARLLGHYGTTTIPVFIVGDLNATASGPRWPRRDWSQADYPARDSKAHRTPSGIWVDATDAIDHLIGEWDDRPDPHRPDGTIGRVDGCGFFALPEVAHATGTGIDDAFRATVNAGVDPGGSQLIDHCLTNQPHLYLPGSYRVHLPARQYNGRWDSDHRLGEATFDLTAPPDALTSINDDLARSYRLLATSSSRPPH